ncbi:hypothetical protein OESDEN_13542 [Oesophagostomum dentatum]|uniref:Uncharacterized protein n=1 Tax=Oesophagostomum dentatum TaxID=61180 RepID=A0A0B1SN17_OESDE|nr:hypothetical protein OESDEN_13542 [Oesophagostomum dentatum]
MSVKLYEAAKNHTTLTACFELNKKSEEVAAGRIPRTNAFIDLDYLYTEMPEHFTLTKTADKAWMPRKKDGSRSVRRMFVVSPEKMEQHQYAPTFMEAAKQKGLMRDDQHIVHTNRRASEEEEEDAAYCDIEERIAWSGKILRNIVQPPALPPLQLNEVTLDPRECE